MANSELAMIAVILMLSVVIAILAYRLSQSSRQLEAWASRCLEHSMAWSDVQRQHMNARLQEDRAELLLREARSADAVKRGIAPERHRGEQNHADISIPIGSNGVVT